jgi:hypothetical protein
MHVLNIADPQARMAAQRLCEGPGASDDQVAADKAVAASASLAGALASG